MYQSGLKSDTELMTDLMGKTNAEKTLKVFELHSLDGIGEGSLLEAGLTVGAAHKLMSALEIGKRIIEDVARSKPIQCSQDAYDLYRAGLAASKQEMFLCVCLNSKNEVTAERTVAMGSVNECRVEPADVFHFAVQERANRVILFHNHPSGDSTPSPQDVALTKRLVAAGELIGISVLEHIVIGRGNYASFKDLGLMADPNNKTVKALHKEAELKKAAEPQKAPKKRATSRRKLSNADFLESLKSK